MVFFAENENSLFRNKPMIKLYNFEEKNGHFKIDFYKGNSTFRRYHSIRLVIFLHIYIPCIPRIQ